MSKLKDKKLSLLLGSSAVTGGQKPLVRHSSVNLPVNRRLNTPTKGTVSDLGGGSSGLGSGATPTNQTKATPPHRHPAEGWSLLEVSLTYRTLAFHLKRV